MAIDWSVECCNDKQFLSIFLIICYAVVIFKLCERRSLPVSECSSVLTPSARPSFRWRVSILHPFKILYVVLHTLQRLEGSHQWR
jgi:hypothetical protein